MSSPAIVKVLLVIVALSTSTAVVSAQDDPCANYHAAMAYSRTKDATPVTLVLTEPRTGAEIEMRLPRNFTGNRGNLTDGAQCQIAFELMWPQMTAGGLVDENDKRIPDRMIGDVPALRLLTIDIFVVGEPWVPRMLASQYCQQRIQLGELSDRPFGLRAMNDRAAWPQHRQSDGRYRSMQELLPYPHNSANVFFFIDDDPEQMIRIHCSNGAPRCRLQGHFRGFQTTTFINGDDLANWRTYRDEVRKFLAAHTVRVVPPGRAADHGLHGAPSAALSACMWSMEKSVGADTLRAMGFR